MPTWFPVRVAGASMEPTLRDGDVLAVRTPRTGEPRPGQMVVVARAGREDVKRAVRMLPDGTWWVEGDNAAASTDSRATGPVAPSAIVGVVRARYRPVRRARLF